jgi:hypothetical protein
MGMYDRVRGAILGTIAALCLPRAVHAQGGNEVGGEATPAETTPAEATPAPAPTPAPVVAPAPAKPWTFEPYGFLRMQYRIVQNDPNVQYIGRNDGFELQHARLGVRGLLGDRVRYVFAVEGAVDERLEVNVPEGKLRLALRDAFADVALGGKLAVRGGYFLSWFDPDLDDELRRTFVDRPIESRGVRATQGYQADGMTPGRSIGAALRLEPDAPASGAAFGFELAVQNGADEYASDNDNDTPAASASLLLRFPHDTALIASGRFNRRTEGDLPLRTDEDDLEGSVGGRAVLGPAELGGGVVFRRTSFPSTGGPVQNGYGAHAQLLVRVPGARPIAIGYRFGILDLSSLVLTDRVMEHTLGGSLAFPALHLRLQLQAVHVMEQAARTLSNDRVQLAAEVVL